MVEMNVNGKTVRCYTCDEKLPDDYQECIVFGENIVKSAEYIKRLFECDDCDLYGTVDGGEVMGASSFKVDAWIPVSELYEAITEQKYM